MKQISLLFLETSVFFFSSVNIFTSQNRDEFNKIKNSTHNQIEERSNNNYIPNRNTTINEINSRIKMKKRNNNNNQSMFAKFSTPKKEEYNYNIRQNISTSNNNPQIGYNLEPGETKYRYNRNQDENQKRQNNNRKIIMTEEDFPYMRQDSSRRLGYTLEPKEETINAIQQYNLESKEETSKTKKNILIKHNSVYGPKKQDIRSYVTNGGNNRRGCCGIKNLKIEKNTVDMEKAKKNINSEIEKTIIEKFKNITFNIVLDNEEIKEIRDIVVGNIDKIIIDNKGKEEKKEKKVGKKKNKKESKKQKEKEDKEKIIAAKISIVQSCINEIENDDGSYFINNDEINNAICLFEKFKNLLNTELKNLQINDNKNKEILDNGDNEVKKIFEKHFGKEIENIITNDDFIRKKYEKFNESEINEGLGELDNFKKENYDEYKERLNEFFKCIKTKTLANINEKKTKEFAANMKNELVGNIIEKVSEKVSIEKVKEKGIEIINKNTSKEDDNKNKNKNKDNIELKELQTKKN